MESQQRPELGGFVDPGGDLGAGAVGGLVQLGDGLGQGGGVDLLEQGVGHRQQVGELTGHPGVGDGASGLQVWAPLTGG